MEEERRETRQRSRSKTPLTLRSSIDRDVEIDGEKKKTKKNPTVETITEESPAPVQSQRATRPKRNSAKITNDEQQTQAQAVNKDTAALIANSVAVVPSAISATEQNKTTQSTVTQKTTIVTTTKSIKSTSGEQVLNEKSQTINKTTSNRLAATREANQNESNLLLEQNSKLRTSTPRANNKEINFNENSITNGANLEDHAAFKEYKEAGEYWNKFPKTDYTYSKLSRDRREIKPGVVAMPNMSRRSLEHHHERVNSMIRRDPAQESFFRSRYEALSSLRKRAVDSYYDSQDETDYSFGQNGGRTFSNDSRSFVRRFIIVITTFFSSIYYRLTSIFRHKQTSSVYYARYDEPKQGLFGRAWQSIVNGFFAVFRFIYLGISTVLFLDSWVLQSSNASSGKKKHFLLSLLILLPLLLLGAWNLSEESDRMYYRERLKSTMPSLMSLPSFCDSMHGTFDDYVSRTGKIVPIALALIQSQTTKVSDKMKFLFDFNWNWLPNVWNSQTRPIDNIHASLSSKEYQNILNHINVYIETIINNKIENVEKSWAQKHETIDPKVAQLIANIINAQIIEYKYILTDGDYERIAEMVRIKLAAEWESNKAKSFSLSQENLEEISNIVKQNIEIHRHEWTIAMKNNEQNDANTETKPTNLDVDEILFKILSSKRLKDLIEGKLLNHEIQLLAHQQSIDQLKIDVKNLKEKVQNIFAANEGIVQSLDDIKTYQGELSDQITLVQNENNEKIQKFLKEIDIKFNAFNENQFNAVNNHIRTILIDILGYKSSDGTPIENIDITNWMRNIFVAKDLLESRLNEMNGKFENRLADEINQSASVLIKEISQKIKHDINIAIEENRKEIIESGRTVATKNISLDESRIREIIRDALAKYDADKTGMVDYALETSGGEVLSTRCTENFHVKSAQISIFGVPIWYKSNTPRSVISPNVQPGECWSFQGFPGYLVLKLNHNVYVTGFTMEHIPKSLTPNGRIDSAPKTFTVWGLETVNDSEPYPFGEYQYLENGTSLQYFPVQNYDQHNIRSHNIIELRIESNHGNINYTCLYRFRVHGALTPTLT